MKLLLLLFVAVAANAATLGSRKCSHGPAYWCGTINQAKECGAVQYCLDNHWPNIKTTESSFCTDCKAGIGVLREELSKASTENDIINYVEKFCKDLGTLAEDCKLVIDAYGPEVLKALIQELKPEQVCALMGFCKGETVIPNQKKDNSAEILALVMTKSSSKVMKLLLSQVEGNADQCTDCTNFLGDVKNLLNNATVEQMITNEIEMVCNYLGPYKDECKLIVSTLVPQGIGQLVQRFVPKDVCTEIGFCKSSLLGTEDPVPEPPPNDPCSDCKAFMGDIKTLLSNATVQKMIIQELESICNSLGSFAPQCQQYVSQYGPIVFGVALQYFDPNTVCGYIGFCKAEDAPRKLLFTSNDLCSDCTTVVQDITTLLKNPNVQTAIIHEIENICDDLGSLGPQCRQYVDQYAPLVFNIALQYLTPSTVCGALGLCPGEEEPEALPEPGDICTDCKNFVKDFDAVLNNYTVQEKLLKDLLVLCKFIPTYQSECEQYLPQYGGLVFEVIAGLLNPKTICKDISLCQGQTTPIAEDVLLSSPEAGDPCSECEAIFKDIQTLLTDPAVQKMIITNVETLCSDLGALAPICKKYVDEYGPLVINALTQYIMPKQFCSFAGLCSGGLPQWLLNLQMPQVEGDLCTDCKALVSDADGLLTNATVQVILALVEEDKMFLNDLSVVCKYFGGLSGECKQLIFEYGPLVFDFLATYIDPTTICDDIGLCPSLINLSGDHCADCTNFFQDVSTVLNTPSVQQMILQQIENVCNDLGSLGPQCQQYVSQYGPLVINFLLQYLDPNTVCKEIGFCSGTCQAPPKLFSVNADQCTDCKNFFQDVSTLLNNPSTQQMILQDIENLCNDLGSLGPQCQQYVSEYGPLVINFLLQYLDPSAICGDIGFCTSVSRPPMKLVSVNADQCTDCKNFFQDVSTLLNNPSTQQMILQDIENLCNDLGSLGPQCQQYVSEYGPLVINFLLQYLDPSAVCSDIGFCSSISAPPPVNADQCTDCKNFFQDVSTLLNNATVQQMILQDIENLCNDLGSLGPQCQQYVSEYGPLVINFLLQYLDPNAICGDIGFCSAVSRPTKMFEVNADQCTDCKNFFQDVSTLLNNPSTQQMILQDIENLCNDLGSLGPQCQQYVSEYGPLVINFLLQYLDPTAICGDIGFCSAVSKPPTKLFGVNADQCTDCKNFFQDVSTLLNNPSTQQTILQDIENLCNDLGSLGPQCQQYVSEYGPLVINFLLQYLDPTAICGDIGFCSAVSRPPTQLFGVNADQCTDCKNFFQDVSTLLNNPATQQMILQDIENLCNDLGSLGPQCQQYVSEYGPLVINFLLQYLDPTAICGDIGFCSAVSRPPTKLFGVNADQCTDCKNFFQDVSTLLNNPATQQMILQDIENLCNDLGSLGPQCQQYVSEYGPLVINFLLQYLDPTAICGDIGFCSAVSRPPTKLFGVNADQCTDCKNFFQDVSTLLNNPATQQMILQDIENLCNDLGSLGPQCQQYVSEYGPLVINFLLQYLDPTAICGDIGFCSAMSRPPTKLFGVNADQCTDCKNFFQDVSTLLNNPATQQMILQDIENLCNDLGSLGPQCQQYVSEYGPLVINFLLQYLDPTAICGDIGFCSAVSRPPTKLFGVNADQCTDCKNFFQDVSTLLNNPSTQQMILQDIENLCNDLGSLGPQCQQYVSEYGPLVINFLLQYLDPTAICGDIGFCSAVSRPPTKLFGVNADQCTDCKNFFQDVSTLLNNPSTQQMILQDIENLCNDLGSLGPQCQQYVSEYGPLVINFLLQYLDPTSICGDIGFCPSLQTIPAMELVAAHPISRLDQEPPVDDGTVACTVCKMVVQKVEVLLKDKKTEAQITAALERFCTLLPTALSRQCVAFVDQYGPVIVNLLVNQMDPQQVCSFIKLCRNDQAVYPISRLDQEPPVDDGTVACTVCKMVVQKVEVLIKDKKTEAQITAALERFCTLLPTALSRQCVAFVDQYGPVVIELLVNQMDPQQVCSFIKLCRNDQAAYPISRLDQEPPVDDGTVACTVCKMVVQKVEVLIKDKKTEAQITAALERFCTLLPTALSRQCVAFVDQYGPVVIELLVNQMDPEQVCSFIKLCRNDQAAYPISRLDQEPPVDDGTVACTVCKMVVQKVEVLIKDKKTEAQITAALERFCTLLPTALSRQCVAFVDQYGPVVIELLVNQMDPEQVCSFIKLCRKDQELQNEVSQLCTICEFAMVELDKLILDQSSISDVRAALDKLCSLLPPTVRESCESFVKNYAETIVQLIVQEVSPKLVCRAIGVCMTEQSTTAVQKYEILPTCPVCMYVVRWLEKMITKESTMDQIEKLLEEVCTVIPKQMRGQCQTFVDKYVPQIMNLLMMAARPRLICNLVHMCIFEEAPIPEPQVEANELCGICEFAMSELDKLLTQPSAEAEIEKALDEVCGLLPATLSETCKTFVSQYTKEIIFLITQSVSPKQVCTALTLCTSQTVEELTEEKSPVPILEDDLEASTECIVCEFAFRELEGQLEKNATEEEIKMALQEVCSLLPESLADDCNILVTYYTTEVIYQFLKKYPANKICTLLRVCAAVDGELTAVTHLDVQQPTPECAICEFAARELETLLQKNSTEASIRNALNLVCDRLPSTVAKDCQMFIDYYTEEIIFILVSQFPPDKICATLQLCDAADVTLLNAEPAVETVEIEASPECVICEFVARELEQMLQKNSTEAEVIKALDSVCSRLPATVAKDCEMFVEYYTQEIVFILVSQFPPDKLCTTLRICAASQTTPAKVEVKEPEASSVTCEVCQYAMKYLESVLSDNATEAEIEAALEKICSLVPSSYKAECDAFVQEYTAEIVKLILSEVSPSEVCSALGLCSAVEADPSISCEVCLIAIRTAELYITKNSTEQEIDKILENLCKQFPGTLQEQCVSFVESFGNAIPELIVTFVNPEKVCALLDVCPREVDSKYSLFERCNTGPEFWCATQANADLCNAVEHCKRHVWN